LIGRPCDTLKAIMVLGQVIGGLCILLFGRRLFWLFVGGVGFVLGMDLAALLLRDMPHSEVLLIALVGGLVGAVLALAVEELMIGDAGFMAGAYIAGQILIVVMPYPGRNIWVAMLVGGIVGVLLLVALFDWALIVLSSLVGAGLVTQALALSGGIPNIPLPFPFIALTIAGIMVQARLKDREHIPAAIRKDSRVRLRSL